MRKGRFQKAAAKIAQRYGESVSFDRRLYRHDIAGSIAHTAARGRAHEYREPAHEKNRRGGRRTTVLCSPDQ